MVEFVLPQSAPQATQAGRVEFGATRILTEASQAAQGAADSFSAYFEEKASIQAERVLAETQAEWSRRMSEAQPGAGFAERTAEEFREFAAQQMQAYGEHLRNEVGSNPNRGAERLQLALDNYGTRIEAQALQAEARARAAAASRARSETLRARQNAIISDPGLAAEFVEADPANAEIYWRTALTARSRTDEGALGVGEEVQAGNWDQYLSPEQKLAFLNNGDTAAARLDRIRAEEDRVAMASLANEAQEGIDYLTVTGTILSGLPAALAGLDQMGEDGAAAAAALRQSMEVAMMAYEVNTSPPEAVQRMVEEARAAVLEPGNTVQDVARLSALNATITSREEALAADPAGFVSAQQNTPVAAAWGAINLVDPEDRPAAIQRYIGAVNAEYARLGVSDARVLPQSNARQMVAEFSSMPPADVPIALATLMQEWGPAGASVAEQLRAEGMPAEYAMAARFWDNPAVAARMVGLANVSIADLSQNIEVGAVRDMRLSISDETADFRAAFVAGDITGSAIQQFNAYMQVAEKLILADMQSGDDTSRTRRDVISSVFPETPINSSDMRALIPPGMNVGQVRQSANAMIRTDLPGFDIAPLDDPSLSGYVNERLMRELVQNSGVWMNNSTGDGLVLHFPLGGTWLPVQARDGAFFEFKFTQTRATFPSDIDLITGMPNPGQN